MDSEKITNLINETGTPFQILCAEIANKKQYHTLSEYPFTFPPSNGPLLGQPGTIDFLALMAKSSDPVAIMLIVECKRASDKIKHWVFPEVPSDMKDSTLFISSCPREENGKREIIEYVEHSLKFPDLGYSTIHSSYEALTQGFEANERLNINRDTSEKIYVPLRQVNTGLKAVIHKTIGFKTIRTDELSRILYLPVVVTTANLYLAKFNFSDISISTGEVAKDKISYVEKDWVSYQFPLPDYLAYINGLIAKTATFIVNANHWEEFLDKVTSVSGLVGGK